MDYPWITKGLSPDHPWIFHGLSMDNPRIIRGLSIDNPWIIQGLSLDYPGIIHRQFLGELEADILGGVWGASGWPVAEILVFLNFVAFDRISKTNGFL